MTLSVYSLTPEDWKDLFTEWEISPNVLSFWLEGLYKNQNIWKKHLSFGLLNKISEKFNFSLPAITYVNEALDGTVKFQMQFQDKLEVETVLIPFHKRFTVCLSTQVGCGMNCSFCYTGTQGLKRNLEAGEIVGQYIVAFNWLKERSSHALSPSIVFMGQGEPLHNVENTKKAVEILNHSSTLGVGHRQMTLSTVGYMPGIKRLKDFPRINIALSLHSPFEEERARLIPIEKKYSLKEVLEALSELPLLKRQFITFEYLLISNLNMTDEHAQELAALLENKKALINLIPFNPFPGSQWLRPSQEEIENFQRKLVEKKLRVMLRTTKGDDILAACGQLRIKEMARNYGSKR